MAAADVDWPSVKAASAWRLAIPRTPLGGRLGERLGAGTGSSLEFQDYRPYAPGDDLRHVDWTAYARSEVLTVRLYREEVAPRIDLILDASRSMAVTDVKRRARADLTALLAMCCVATESDTRLFVTPHASPARLARAEEIDRHLRCDDEVSVLQVPHAPLRRRSVRVVVSDFLFPHDAESLVAGLARDGASLTLIQLTLRQEASPDVEGGRRLIDVEDGSAADLVIDEEAIAGYKARFGRMRLGLVQAARRRGALFAHVDAETPIGRMARDLAGAGILVPR